jgi:hypothetical protein
MKNKLASETKNERKCMMMFHLYYKYFFVILKITFSFFESDDDVAKLAKKWEGRNTKKGYLSSVNSSIFLILFINFAIKMN